MGKIKERYVTGRYAAPQRPHYLTGAMSCNGRVYIDYALNAADWARKNHMHLSEIVTGDSGRSYEIYVCPWPEMAMAIPCK